MPIRETGVIFTFSKGNQVSSPNFCNAPAWRRFLHLRHLKTPEAKQFQPTTAKARASCIFDHLTAHIRSWKFRWPPSRSSHCLTQTARYSTDRQLLPLFKTWVGGLISPEHHHLHWVTPQGPESSSWADLSVFSSSIPLYLSHLLSSSLNRKF